MLLIDAIYIHESGGKTLLEYLIESLSASQIPFFLLADKRLDMAKFPLIPEENLVQLKATEHNRKQFYLKNINSFQTIYCFANIPPPVTIKEQRVFIFFQNILMLSSLFAKTGYGIKQKIVFFLKRIYILFRNAPQYQWLVQTSSVKDSLCKRLYISPKKVHIIPFFAFGEQFDFQNLSHQPNTFVYAADGVPHKNHLTLLDAWEYLFDHYQLKPELHLTVPDRFVNLLKRMDDLKIKGLLIINHGRLDKQALNILNRKIEYLIFPSLLKSFGLPLMEAVQAGVKVLAADLPYVYDVIIPSAVFDPMNFKSIAEVVAKSMSNKNIKESTILVRNEMDHLIQVLKG